MPDHLSPEERALIDAALPRFRNRKIKSGVSGDPDTTIGGWKRPLMGYSPGARVAKKAEEAKRRALVVELYNGGISRAEIATRVGASVSVVAMDIKSLRILGMIKGEKS